MKKSLIALAVLASSGAAMAQSSVTIYGLVDAAVEHTSTTTAAGVKTNQNVVDSSGANNSRWGLKGTEDLGNGLKANFVLEAGFKTDTGADANLSVAPPAGTAFGRQAWVGLSGDFGAVSLGRQYTAYDALRAATNNLYDTNLATTNTVWSQGIAGYTNRASNSIAYTSPVFSGFSGAAVVGLGEDKTAATPVSQNNSLHIKYANGPVLVGYAFQEEKLSATVTNKYNLLAGSYDFGVAKLTGGLNQAKNSVEKDKQFQLGVSVPVGTAASVAAGYSYSKNEVGATSTKVSGLSLLGTYSLSKRTTVYAGLEAMKVKDSSAKSSVVAAGIRHTF